MALTTVDLAHCRRGQLVVDTRPAAQVYGWPEGTHERGGHVPVRSTSTPRGQMTLPMQSPDTPPDAL